MALTLQEHMDMLGIDTPRLAQMTRLPESVVTRALTGQPISSAHAERIVMHLGIQHGLPGNNSLHHSDIRGLNIVDPQTLRKK